MGLRINVMRGIEQFKMDIEEAWGNLLHDFDTNDAIELSSLSSLERPHMTFGQSAEAGSWPLHSLSSIRSKTLCVRSSRFAITNNQK